MNSQVEPVPNDAGALDVSSVMLPSAAIEGLNQYQIEIMKETTFIVRRNTRIAGEAIRSSAQELVKLKAMIGRGSWIAFLKSGALPLSEKQARDLVSAWEKWLKDTPLSDGDLANVGSRTLARIASASPDVKEKVMKKLKAGEKITEKIVNDMKMEVMEISKKATADNYKDMLKETGKITTKLFNLNNDWETKYNQVKVENENLKVELEKLRSKIAEYEITSI